MRITIKELYDLTGIHPQTVYKQIARGHKVGAYFKADEHGHYRADEKTVLKAARQFLKEHESEPRSFKKIGFRVNLDEYNQVLMNARGEDLATFCRRRCLEQ